MSEQQASAESTKEQELEPSKQKEFKDLSDQYARSCMRAGEHLYHAFLECAEAQRLNQKGYELKNPKTTESKENLQ